VVGLIRDPHYEATFTGLMHAASADPNAARLWRERIGRDVFLPVTRALQLDQIELRIAAAATQTFGLVVTALILKVDALTALSDDELVALIAPTLQRYLALPL
jgi:hypothetical protein